MGQQAADTSASESPNPVQQDTICDELVVTATSPDSCTSVEGAVDLPTLVVGGTDRQALCQLQDKCKSLNRCQQWGSKNEKWIFLF